MMKKINLENIFSNLKDTSYTVIKISQEFPNYNKGDDIDIFCYSINKVSNIILSSISKIVDDQYKIKITNIHDSQLYIDIIEDGKIHFRFDLYNKLPKYNNLLIKEGLFNSVVENSVLQQINGVNVKVPAKIDEIILRYIEYHEWFSKRPDKIKHIDYILNSIEKEEVKKTKFLEKLHYNVQLPPLESLPNKRNTLLNNSFFGKIKTLFNIIKRDGLKYTYKRIKAKLTN